MKKEIIFTHKTTELLPEGIELIQQLPFTEEDIKATFVNKLHESLPDGVAVTQKPLH